MHGNYVALMAEDAAARNELNEECVQVTAPVVNIPHSSPEEPSNLCPVKPKNVGCNTIKERVEDPIDLHEGAPCCA